MTNHGWPTRDFEAALVDVTAGDPKTPQADYERRGRHPVVDQGKDLIGGYTNDDRALSPAQLPVIVFGDHTRCVKYVDFPFCAGADGVKVLRASEGLDARFVYWFLRTVQLPEGGYARHFKYLRQVQVPVPPLDEQRRIAAILDAADSLRAKRRQATTKLDTLTRSIFIDMFGESIQSARDKLGDHVATTSGGTPNRSRRDYFEGPIPWVKSGELSSGVVRSAEEHISLEAVANSSAKVMPSGTVLLAMYGATVGQAAVLGIEAATNQAVCCLTPNETVLGPFLLGYLQSVKPELIRRAAGGAQPNISQSIVRDLHLPLPTADAQALYADRVDAIDKVRSMALDGCAQTDALFASLQRRAFRGEL